MAASVSTRPGPRLAPDGLPRAKTLPIRTLTPARLELARILAAQVFAELLATRGIPNTEVAEHIGVPEKLIRQFRSTERGKRPIGVRHVLVMPRRLALAYLDAVRLLVLNDNLEHVE